MDQIEANPLLARQLAAILVSTGAEAAAAYRLDPVAQLLQRVAAGRIGSHQLPAQLHARGPLAECIDRAEIRASADLLADPRWSPLPFASDLRAVVSAPLTVEGIVVGVIVLGHPESGFFGDEQVAHLAALASELSLALAITPEEAPETVVPPADLADLDGAVRDLEVKQRAVVAELHRVAQSVADLAGLDQVFPVIAGAAARFWQPHAIIAYLAYPDVAPECWIWYGESQSIQHLAPVESPDAWAALHQDAALGQPLVIADGRQDPRTRSVPVLATGTVLAAAIPTSAPPIGVLAAAWLGRRGCDPLDLDLWESLAAALALTLENSRLALAEDQAAGQHARAVEAARLEGVLLAARTAADAVGNDLAVINWLGVLALRQVRAHHPVDPAILALLDECARGGLLDLRRLRGVVRVETHPAGLSAPLLDLDRSSF